SDLARRSPGLLARRSFAAIPLHFELRGIAAKERLPPRATPAASCPRALLAGSRHPGRPGLRLLGPGLVLLPDGPALQQRPHHPPRVVCLRPPGVLLRRGVAALGPLEEPRARRRAPRGLPAGLGDELADDRQPLAGDVPQPVPVARLVLARHQPEVPADRL